MKKLTNALFLSVILCPIFSFSQEKNWITVQSTNAAKQELSLISSTIDHTVLRFSVSGFYLNEVETPKGKQTTVTIENGVPL